MDRNQKMTKSRALSETNRRKRNLLLGLSEHPPVCNSPSSPNVKGRAMFSLKPEEFVCNQAFAGIKPKCITNDVQNTCPSPCQCTKTDNDNYVVDCSNKRLTAIPKSLPLDTVEIRLDDNMLTEIPGRAFAAYKKLLKLDISRNPIVKIDEKGFEGLENLNKLSCYDTQIEVLPANVFSEYTKNLEILLLHKNRLKCLPFDSFNSLTGLTTLSLFDNKLESIPPGLFQPLKSLRLLHLAKNPIKCDCKLKDLVQYLKENDVERSGAVCGGASPKNLLRVNLPDLKFSELNCLIGHSNYPDQCNEHIKICPKFCECNSLGKINCIDSGIKDLKFLKSFDETLSTFRELDLSSNSIEVLDLPAGELTNLIKLTAGRNKISKFYDEKEKEKEAKYATSKSKLQQLPISLRILRLGYNNLNILNDQTFKNLNNLEELTVRDNYITCIEEQVFTNLPKLKYLDLSNNQIRTLPATTFLLNFRNLNVVSNPIECESRNSEMLRALLVRSKQTRNIPVCIGHKHDNDGNGNVQNSDVLLTDLPITSFKEKTPRLSCTETDQSCPKNCICTSRRRGYVIDCSNKKLLKDNFGNSHSIPKKLLENTNIASEMKFDSNDLQILPEFKQLYKLKTIDFNDNKIRQIKTNTFNNLENLQTIILSNNRINCIEAKAFNNLPKLASINFANNELQVLGENSFYNLNRLDDNMFHFTMMGNDWKCGDCGMGWFFGKLRDNAAMENGNAYCDGGIRLLNYNSERSVCRRSVREDR